MRIAKALILVKIDKAAQTQKRSKIGSILLHHSYVFMERNLQYGVVTQIGEVAAKNYPEISVDDEIAFHHTIEDDSGRVLDVDSDGNEYLYIYAGDKNDNYEIYGTFKTTGELIPPRHFVWLAPNATPIKRKPTSGLLALGVDASGNQMDDWDTPENLRSRIEQLKEQRELLEPSISATRYTDDVQKEYDRRVEVINAMNALNDECEQLTRLLSKRRLGIATAIAINSDIKRHYPALTPGSQVIVSLPLYPLDIYNEADPVNSARFLIVRTTEILGYAKD